MTNEEFMARRIAPRARALVADLEPNDEADEFAAPDDRIIDGLLKALLAGETHYTDRPGMGELRAHIAERLSAGLDPARDKDTVIVTNSDAEALFACLLGIRMSHAKASPGLLQAILPGGGAEPKPSGQSDRDASLASLLGFRVSREAARNPKPWVGSFGIPDAQVDVFRLRGLDPTPLESLDVAAESLVIGVLELEGLAALPVGYASVPSKLAKAVRTWKQALSICTAAPSQRATLLALGVGKP